MNIWSILLSLLIFSLLIFIHELGHFIVARLCGVKVLEFAIGMGPRLLSWKSKKSGTVYAVRAFPIGGFVNMLGENGMEAVQGDNGTNDKELPSLVNETDDLEKTADTEPQPIDPTLAKQAYCNQNVWKRLLISVAGPFMNIALGFILMLSVVLMQGHDYMGTTEVARFVVQYQGESIENGLQTGDQIEWVNGSRLDSKAQLTELIMTDEDGILDLDVLRYDAERRVVKVALKDVSLTEESLADFAGSKSEETGLRLGDKILKINSAHTHIMHDVSYEIMMKGNRPMTITVLRDGEKVKLENVSVPTQTEAGSTVGLMDFQVRQEKNYNPFTILKHSWFRSITNVKMVYDSLIGLFTGRFGIESVSGPIGLTTAVGDVAKAGFTSVLNLVVIISVNLGVMNLLPIPALDGGHIFIYLIEVIRRKPMKKEVEGIINFVGLILILGLAVIIAIKDIITIIL